MKPQLFLLDLDPAICAQSYTDAHLLAYIPILTEIMRSVDAEVHPYKRHILSKWCGNKAAYNWVNILVAKMIKEAEYRFNIDTDRMLEDLHTLAKHKAEGLPARWLQLIPDAQQGNPVKAYREYYSSTQRGATWTKRQAPSWFNNGEQTAFNFT
jgi:hypothetical protein